MIDQHTCTASLADGTALNVSAASLTLDESWSPYAQGELTITTPADLSLVDPRGDVRVQLLFLRRFGLFAFTLDWSAAWGGKATSALSVAWGGKATSAVSTDPGRRWNSTVIPGTARAANLSLRSRQVRTDGTTVLTLTSDEALLQDLKQLVEQRVDNETTVAGLIGHVFTTVLAGTESLHHFTLAGTITDAPLLEPSQIQDAGLSYWDYFTPFLQQANRRLYCDEHGVFHLITHDDAGTAGTVTLQASTNVTESTDVIDRDSDVWGDSVVVEYELSAGDNSTMRVSHYGVASPSKTLYLKVPGRAPFSQFSDIEDIQAPARNIYTRLIRRGRVVPITALSNYAATPGQTTSIELPSTPDLTGLLAAVQWRFPDAEMTITSRNLQEV